MTDHTHQTAPTQFADGAGIRFAYRRFGKNQGVPLVFFQDFTGTIDNWDPAVTDGLARDREVILFNNAGISSSSGETPNTITEMARHAAAFIDALGLKQIDLLGFSLGGLVAPAVDSGPSQACSTSCPRRNRTAQRRRNGEVDPRSQSDLRKEVCSS
jgi:alpha/beta hydrolase fold